MKFFSTLTTCTVALACSLSFLTTPSLAQQEDGDVQIEIVNQDGEQVKNAEIRLTPPIQAGVATAVGDGTNVSVNKDGKITIVDGDGNKREIDVSGARSIIVNQSVRSIMKNGEEQRLSFGKAIIIGPDGKRQEIELLPGQPNTVFSDINPGENWDQFQVGSVKNSYMIGVHCSPVSELVSKQLRLESNTGLVVEAVSKDTPSQAAGIEKHDILMFADDQQLSTIKNLTEVVQSAGKEKSKISLTLLRAGKEMNVEVTPIDRPAGSWSIMEAPGPGMLPPNIDFQFRRLAPGAIMGPQFGEPHKQMEEQMKAVREQIEQLKQEMHDQFDKEKF